MREEIKEIFLKENINLDLTDETYYNKEELLNILGSATRLNSEEYIDDIKVIDLILDSESKLAKRLRKHLNELGNKKLLKHFESLIAIDEVINDCCNKSFNPDDIIWELNKVVG